MKKTFKLDHPKIKTARIVDSIKHDVKKFQKKESAAKLPKGMKFWSMDCKLGQTEETATAVPYASLMSSIDDLVLNKVTTIYVEMSANAVATLEEAKT